MTHDPMPVFVIKAKDKLAWDIVAAYQTMCDNAGLHKQADQVELALEEIRAWQQRNPGAVHAPDHVHVPATEGSPS